MKKTLVLILCISFIYSVNAQDDCFAKLQKAFEVRGAYSVIDGVHENVIITFFTPDGNECISGKADVENGTIVRIYLLYDDNTLFQFEKKYYNSKKETPTITNGMSEMIYTIDNEKFRVVFIETLKPKEE